MLTKQEFLGYLDFIYKQREKEQKFISGLEILSDNVEYCNCFCYAQYEDKFVELLKRLMNDTTDELDYFLYEMDSGKSWISNENYSNAEELYDYLATNNK